FVDPPYEEETLSFIRTLGHFREIKFITDVIVDHLHQSWSGFASIISKCLIGKVSGLDKIRLSRAQILWGMFYKKNVDFVALIWEDFAYQIDNRDSKKQEKMYYPRFTKVIINHFLTKNPSILMRNRMFMHTTRDDTILGILKFVSKHEDVQVYGALLPKEMTNPTMLNSESFKTYYVIATGAEPPKSKKVSPAGSKKKAPAKADTGKGLKVLSEVALSEEAQLREVLKRSKQDFHGSQASGSGASIDEGTGTKPGVPDVPKHDSES
ncbi:hypothetical protein Tco_0108154, partial [Tanacetum coccineum]